MIKIFSTFVFQIVLIGWVQAQTFYIADNSTTLIKSTDQSPAHWYIEIVSNEEVDTTMRWKAHFMDVPQAWTISFDDQSNYHTNVDDGDSADFTLFSGMDFPQKLIIGAMLNDIAGNATVLFEIYDPITYEDRDSIYYHFIISPVGLKELKQNNILKYSDGKFIVLNDKLSDFRVIDFQGRTVLSSSNVLEFEYSPDLQKINFIEVKQGKERFVFQWSSDMPH